MKNFISGIVLGFIIFLGIDYFYENETENEYSAIVDQHIERYDSILKEYDKLLERKDSTNNRYYNKIDSLYKVIDEQYMNSQ